MPVHFLDDLCLKCRDLLLQGVGLTHRGLVFLLILCVFQVAVGPFEICLVLGDLLFETRPVRRAACLVGSEFRV